MQVSDFLAALRVQNLLCAAFAVCCQQRNSAEWQELCNALLPLPESLHQALVQALLAQLPESVVFARLPDGWHRVALFVILQHSSDHAQDAAVASSASGAASASITVRSHSVLASLSSHVATPSFQLCDVVLDGQKLQGSAGTALLRGLVSQTALTRLCLNGTGVLSTQSAADALSRAVPWWPLRELQLGHQCHGSHDPELRQPTLKTMTALAQGLQHCQGPLSLLIDCIVMRILCPDYQDEEDWQSALCAAWSQVAAVTRINASCSAPNGLLQAFAELPNLQDLTLDGMLTAVDDFHPYDAWAEIDIDSLCQCVRLTSLSMRNCQDNTKPLNFSNMTQLQILDLCGMDDIVSDDLNFPCFTSHALCSLASCTALRRLSLGSSPTGWFGPVAAQQLCASMLSLTALTELTIEGHAISTEAEHMLAAALAVLPALQILEVPIWADGLPSLASYAEEQTHSIPLYPALTSLCLQIMFGVDDEAPWQEDDDEAASARIAAGIAQMQSLQHLTLLQGISERTIDADIQDCFEADTLLALLPQRGACCICKLVMQQMCVKAGGALLAIAGMQGLSSLTLDRVHVLDDLQYEMTWIWRLSNLVRLQLGIKGLGVEERLAQLAQGMSKLTCLASVHLVYSRFSADGVRSILHGVGQSQVSQLVMRSFAAATSELADALKVMEKEFCNAYAGSKTCVLHVW